MLLPLHNFCFLFLHRTLNQTSSIKAAAVVAQSISFFFYLNDLPSMCLKRKIHCATFTKRGFAISSSVILPLQDSSSIAVLLVGLDLRLGKMGVPHLVEEVAPLHLEEVGLSLIHI